MVTETKPTPPSSQGDDAHFIERCLDECWDLFLPEANPADPRAAEVFLKGHFRPFFTNQLRGDPDGVWESGRAFVLRGTRTMAGLAVDRARLNGRQQPNHDDLEWAAGEIPFVACAATDAATEPSDDGDVQIRGGWCTQGPEAP